MSKLLTGEQFNEKLYNTLPPVYRNEDTMVDYALERYLNVLSDGGFSKVIEEINGILDFNDPEKTPKEVLSVVFSQYGLEIFNGLPEMYLRKLLPILGDLYARKGATTVIEYLTSIISDVKSEVIISPDFLEDYHVDIKLEMDYDQQGARDIPDREQLLRIIKEFLPFFINVTTIFSYLFYETARLKTKDEEVLFHVTDIRNDEARIVRQKGEGLFPTINNLELGLNTSVILNESYYYDVDVDYFVDKIINHFLVKGVLDSSKSHQYLRPALNDLTKVLNNSLVLNEYMDTDELAFTNISYLPMEDSVRLGVFERVIDTVKRRYDEECSVSSVGLIEAGNSVFNIGDTFGNVVFNNSEFVYKTDELLDRITHNQKEVATFRSDKSTEIYKESLNNVVEDLNDSLHLNEGVDTDEHIDRIRIDDESKVSAKDFGDNLLTLGDQRFYASTNTDFVLNRDLITNESLADIGSVLTKEYTQEKMVHLTKETSSIEVGHDSEIMAFLNTSVCVLNTMLLNNISDCVKITVNGQTQVKYPTVFGLM